jgi:RHS repeat-associated protein
MIDSTGTTERTYDEQNRVKTKTVPVIGQTNYSYDGIEEDGRYYETTTDPKVNATTKVYDKAGRLLKVISGGKTTTYEYYDNGSQKKVIYPDGSTEEYTYYADGLIMSLTNKKASGVLIDYYSYTYDEAHNQTSKTDSKGVTGYTYDSLGRLESTTEPNGRVTNYTFDKAGNRLTETVTVGTSSAITTYDYNEQNRLTGTVTNSGSETIIVSYKYDNNGNMVSKSTEKKKPVNATASGSFQLYKAGTTTESAIAFYKYDVWNQLAEAVSGDKKEKYKYNGEGYRVVKNDNNKVTNYLYEYDKVILETDNANNQLSRNVYGTNLISRTSGSETLYYMYNGHADVTALIDNLGTVKGSYYYDAFGNIIEQTGNVNNNITYAGYQYDSETGLYYLNARYYDSKIARFLSEDTYTGNPSDPLSLNLYTYCINNPIMYVDPTGHEYQWWHSAGEVDQELEEMAANPVTVNITWEGYVQNVGLNEMGHYMDSGWEVYDGNAYADNMTVDSAVSIDTMNVAAGSNVNIDNRGIIGTINTGVNSTTTINNSGITGVINSGAYSSTTINNAGLVGVFNTGVKSTNDVNNFGYVVAINTGLGNHTYIGSGFGVRYAGGNGTIIDDPRYDYLEYILANDRTGYTSNPEINKFIYDFRRGAGYSYFGVSDAASVYGPKAMEGIDNLGNATMSCPMLASPFKVTSAGLRTFEKIAIAIEKAVILLSGVDEIGDASKISNGILKTGARELSYDEYIKLEKLAKKAYNEIAQSTADVSKIAKNTGMNEQRIQRIKDHLFNNEHILDDGIRKFDPDPDIAIAWKRMENGSFNQNDIDLLNHELFESKFEGIYKTNYRTAHDAALESGRNWDPNK